MQKNSKGFTLVEVLGALVVWMIITSLLLPGIVWMNQERKGFILEQQARFILTLELDKVRMKADFVAGKVVSRNGTEYSLILKEEKVPKMLCVVFTDYRFLEQERCAYVHLP